MGAKRQGHCHINCGMVKAVDERVQFELQTAPIFS